MSEIKWISVNDRLPKSYDDVLVAFINHIIEKNPMGMEVSYIMPNGEWHTETARYYPLTHWAELPSPPKLSEVQSD